MEQYLLLAGITGRACLPFSIFKSDESLALIH